MQDSGIPRYTCCECHGSALKCGLRGLPLGVSTSWVWGSRDPCWGERTSLNDPNVFAGPGDVLEMIHFK